MSNFVGKRYLTKTVSSNLVTPKIPEQAGNLTLLGDSVFSSVTSKTVRRCFHLRKLFCRADPDR